MAAFLCFTATALAVPPWQAAREIDAGLSEAQTNIILEESGGNTVERAADDLTGPLRAGLAADAPAELREVETGLAAAERASTARDEAGLAAARGQILAALRRGAMAVAIASAERREPAQAREWLQIRDFRKTTRYTRPGVDGTTAIEELESTQPGSDSDEGISPHEAALLIEKDLLDTYQARLLTNLDEAGQAAERDFDGRFAETTAIVLGYWRAIAAEYGEQRGGAEQAKTERDFERLAAAGANGDEAAFKAARARVEADLKGFTAAPLTPDELVNRASQFLRFIELVPKEYDKGTADGHVTIPFEVQEGVAFMDGVEAAFSDLESELLKRDPGAVDQIEATFAELRTDVDNAQQGKSVAPQEELDAASEKALEEFERIAPDEWMEGGDEADYELVDISLDQLEAAVGAGRYQEAEQARLAAYGFFEFGPELKLRAFDTGLALEIEGLIWYGANGDKGLATLISDNAPLNEIRETRLDLDEKLDDARAITG
ncbi:MAG TPA: hypothetical protein VFB52_09985, partial [Solirubrobacterales bacterium]|nr:hypothetical protein [Solirubrobacterales bacterium]